MRLLLIVVILSFSLNEFLRLTSDGMDSVFKSGHTRLPVMSAKFKILIPILEELFHELSQEEKQQYLFSKEMYLNHVIISEPLIELIEQKVTEFERRGLSWDEIRTEIVSLRFMKSDVR
ncbi:hypothetical protein PENTCL1PPCAC_5738 [Pristionchus entomophagus]|uniref:Uncharacterized protein n=1 Tax=Pristionchus entomophagus TaxID=358040 RepID=A0AAV5SSJ6_9BILA|nr:hypothetical protein PENTCL1PPCAC_5738 [Pristionchus entomophagus]